MSLTNDMLYPVCAVLYGRLKVDAVNPQKDFTDISITLPTMPCNELSYEIRHRISNLHEDLMTERMPGSETRETIYPPLPGGKSTSITLTGFRYFGHVAVELKATCGEKSGTYYGWVDTGSPGRLAYPPSNLPSHLRQCASPCSKLDFVRHY